MLDIKNIELMDGYVLVAPYEQEEKNDLGIVNPNAKKVTNSNLGRIVNVASDLVHDEKTGQAFAIDDVVVFDKEDVLAISINEKENYALVSSYSIAAVFKNR